MIARPQKVVMTVTEDRDILAVLHMPDGNRQMEWLGLWGALKLQWQLLRAGIPVETP